MYKVCSTFTILILVLMSLFLTAQEVNVSGDWELTMETRRGEITRDIYFEQDGENLTVTMESPRGGKVNGAGTIRGNDIEWTITRSSPRGEFSMTYKGKVEGDKMSGEVQMGNFGTFEWKAKRK